MCVFNVLKIHFAHFMQKNKDSENTIGCFTSHNCYSFIICNICYCIDTNMKLVSILIHTANKAQERIDST